MNRLKDAIALSTVRQSIWFMLLFSVVSIGAWGGTYYLVQREMLRFVDARLSERMVVAIAALDAGDDLPAPEKDQSAALTSEDWPEGFQSIDSDEELDMDFRYLVRTTEHGRIVLGENTERQEELRDILAGGMQISLLLSLLATIAAGVWMARRGQARVSDISAGLALVARGRLDTRISLGGPRDDLKLLADRIDLTTARLERAMAQMRVQTSNIAHDLRTPLARLRAQVEDNLYALTEQKQPVTDRHLEAALSQIDDITDTFNALLRLAQIEGGQGRAAFRETDLSALVQLTAETFGPVIEDAGQRLVVDIDTPLPVNGDKDMLVQLLANLIQNALRHGAVGQKIELQLVGMRLSVTDEGPGIAPEDREKVLQPLYRGHATRQEPGFGLGLSLVRAISDLHDADLSLSHGRDGRGLMVTVQFSQGKL